MKANAPLCDILWLIAAEAKRPVSAGELAEYLPVLAGLFRGKRILPPTALTNAAAHRKRLNIVRRELKRDEARWHRAGTLWTVSKAQATDQKLTVDEAKALYPEKP